MSNVAQNEASAEPERPAEGMSDAQLAEVAALRARVADLETARDRAEAKATAYKAERDLAVDWSARKQDAPSGLRVAWLIQQLKEEEADCDRRADDCAGDPEEVRYRTGRSVGTHNAVALILRHLGEPTPAERAAAAVLALDVAALRNVLVTSSDPQDWFQACGDIAEGNANAGPWLSDDGDMERLVQIAAVALAGILACGAKGGA